MGREFRISREVEVAGAPAAVFEAVTTGTAGWMFPTALDAGVGGSGVDDPRVTTWDPPGHFAVRVEGEDGWFNALEYRIDARDGGTAVLRYVHSGVFTEDWDNQYDGAGKHTDFYLHSLGEYVGHFPGRPAAWFAVAGPPAAAGPDAFGTLQRALGVAATGVGDQVRLDIPGLDAVDAVLDYRTPYFVGLRSADALYRFYGRNAFGGTVDLAHHLFAPGADGDKEERVWQGWLAGVYA